MHKIVTVFLLLALTACSSEPQLSADFAPIVSDMARKLMETELPGEVPKEEWPYAIADVLHPESIRIDENGVYIVTSEFFVEEAGIFVARRADQLVPVAGSDPEYKHIVRDVYSYRIKS